MVFSKLLLQYKTAAYFSYWAKTLKLAQPKYNKWALSTEEGRNTVFTQVKFGLHAGLAATWRGGGGSEYIHSEH